MCGRFRARQQSRPGVARKGLELPRGSSYHVHVQRPQGAISKENHDEQDQDYQPAKQAILEVLKLQPEATVAQIAVSAGVGRSTASKLLARLESDGEVTPRRGRARQAPAGCPTAVSLASR